MPQSDMKTVERFALAGRSGKALTNVAHEIKDDQGGVESAGSTDGGGASSQTIGKNIAPVRMKIKVPEAAAEAAGTPLQDDAQTHAAEEELDEQIRLLDDEGNVMSHLPFTARLQSGEWIQGYTDDEGKTGRYVTQGAQIIEVFIGHVS
jgi:hypothetical protein